jgi:hypothetical protein
LKTPFGSFNGILIPRLVWTDRTVAGRGVKLRIGPVLGFKQFATAAITIAGIELLRRIRKRQFSLSGLCLTDQSTPATWNVVLTAQ